MPPIRVVIVDDEPLARIRVRHLLDRAAGRFVVVGETGDSQRAVASALKHGPDVIFLDIQLQDLNGFEVLDALESVEGIEPPQAVVFLTAHDRYAIRAFEANAAHPPTRSAPTAQLPPERRHLTRIVVQDRSRVLLIPVEEMECAIAADNYVKVATANHVHLFRARLSELAERLDPGEFVRVHRSHLVSVRHIRELNARPHGEYHIRLASGRQVRASRAHRDAVRAILSRLDTARRE